MRPAILASWPQVSIGLRQDRRRRSCGRLSFRDGASAMDCASTSNSAALALGGRRSCGAALHPDKQQPRSSAALQQRGSSFGRALLLRRCSLSGRQSSRAGARPSQSTALALGGRCSCGAALHPDDRAAARERGPPKARLWLWEGAAPAALLSIRTTEQPRRSAALPKRGSGSGRALLLRRCSTSG